MFCYESCPWFTRLQNNASSLAVGGYHILVLTLPWVFFSGFQNWILNHSARDILLVGYFPNCVAAPPSDSFARHKLTGRTWLRRPQVGRGRPTPTHRRCISKILWWPNMTLAVDQDCVKTNQYIGDQRSRWEPIDPNTLLSSSPIYDIVTWPVKVCVISNLLYLKPYSAALYQNFHFKLWCFRKTLKFCNEGGLSLINWRGINHITSVFDQRGRRQRSSFFSQLIIQCCHIPVQNFFQ